MGFSVGITPVDNLEVNLALGLGKAIDLKLDAVNRMQAQIGYNIPDIGKVTVTWINADFWPTSGTYSLAASEGFNNTLGLTVYSDSIVEGLSFEVGGSYKLKRNEDKDVLDDKAIKVGLGVHYNGGDFGVKFRLMADPQKGGGDDGKGFQWIMTTDTMPWYNISDSIGTLYCNIRFGISGKDKYVWNVTPYLRNSMGGSGDFRIGALFHGEAGENGAEGFGWKFATSWVFTF
jgi:hypothetical protein